MGRRAFPSLERVRPRRAEKQALSAMGWKRPTFGGARPTVPHNLVRDGRTVSGTRRSLGDRGCRRRGGFSRSPEAVGVRAKAITRVMDGAV